MPLGGPLEMGSCRGDEVERKRLRGEVRRGRLGG